jgi:indole-3-glycerol phosphate synthase
MSILQEILKEVREEVERRKAEDPFRGLPPPRKKRSLIGEIRKASGVSVIAEVKRASPSAGQLRPNADVVKLARLMVKGGAIGISVLTEPKYFKGEPRFLRELSETLEVPLLCKDFVIDPYQLSEAARLGADAVLLITRILEQGDLSSFLAQARELGMEALVEVTNEPELERALSAGAEFIGINNRDLETLDVDLSRTEELAPLVPRGATIVSESGIESVEDVRRVLRAGAHAVLVGTSIIRASNIEEKVRELAEAKP